MIAREQRVLIVEDSPEDAEVFKRYLEREPNGYQCQIAQTAEAGLQRLREERFDCVLLDFNLPDLSGLEFLEAALTLESSCAVVMLTGIGDEQLAVAAMKAGAEDYLTKTPLDRERLRRSVHHAIERFDLKRRLEHEQRRNTAILSSIGDAFVSFDRDWCFTYLNKAAEALLERDASALIGQPLWGSFPQFQGTVFQTELERAAASRQQVSFEAPLLNGQRWLELRVYPAKDGVAVYAADITPRKRDEERRRLLETVAFGAKDAIIITEAEPISEPGPRIIYVNPSFEQMSGYRAEEVIGKTPRILQGSGSSRESLAQIRAALQRLQPIEIEVLNYRKDGSPFWVELSIAPVADANGWVTHWVSVQRDITDRKHSQAQLQQVADISAYRIKLIDTLRPLENPLEIQATAARVLGEHLGLSRVHYGEISPDDEYFVISFGYTRDGPSLTGQFRLADSEPATAALRNGQTFVVPDIAANANFSQAERAGYANVAIAAQVVVPLVKGGRLAAALSSHQSEVRHWTPAEVSMMEETAERTWTALERAKVEAALRESEERHRHLADVQKRFVSDAAHELRAPLTGIRGNLELLVRYQDIPAEERLEMLTDAEREASRLSRLITDMLSVARGDAKQHAEFNILRLDGLLTETLRTARSLAAHHTLECDPLPIVSVLGDRDGLKQLALVLLENAFKYTPPGGTVRVTMTVEDKLIELRVSDNGPGIAPEDLERVFERFYRADRARTPGPDPGGTGLGLPIARLVAEAHGGTVWLESRLGAGTTAVVRLPHVSTSQVVSSPSV